MPASIKKWVNTHYGMLADFSGTRKFMVVCAILLGLNASPANKCLHKFQPGFRELKKREILSQVVSSNSQMRSSTLIRNPPLSVKIERYFQVMQR